MSEWRDIESAPKDGTCVWVRRVYQRRLVVEGWAVFGIAHKHAPQRQPLGPDPLNRLSAADYAREAQETVAYAERPKWLRDDRMYSFPEPTHWLPNPPAPPHTEGN
jgi:hypothetical protein